MSLGTPFELKSAHLVTIQDFLHYLRLRYEIGYDTVIHVKGEERSGKSYSALCLAKILWPELPAIRGFVNDWPELTPLLQETFQRLERHEKHWPWFWLDEATNILAREDWNRVENKATKKLFRQWGYLRALTVLIDPDGNLDKYVLKHRAKIRIIMRGRQAVSVQIQRRDRNLDQDPWWEERLRWRLPDVRERWPQDVAEYDVKKKLAVGFRLDETTLRITEAQNRRKESRLRSQRNIQKLEQELNIKPTQDS